MARQPNALQSEFPLDYYAELIIKQASNVLSVPQLRIVIFYNLAQDARQWVSKEHFDNCAFAGGTKQDTAMRNCFESLLAL